MSFLRCWYISCPRENHFLHWLFLQFHFYIAPVITNYDMFTVMVYDHQPDTCKPLFCGSRVSGCTCLSLDAAPYTYIYLCKDIYAQSILMLCLSLYRPDEIRTVLLCGHFSLNSHLLRYLCQRNCHVCETILSF